MGPDSYRAESRSFGADEGAAQPVFLHGMWRSGTTYIWSRFRKADDVCAYYEPFHHGLDKLNRRRIARDTPEKAAAFGHPAVEKPYFSEYSDLLSFPRGVRRFHRSFAHDRFVLGGDDVHRPLERYVSLLLTHASRDKRRPILACNRTVLRVGWLKRRFASFDIHIDRDPHGVWRSYMQQMLQGNYSFFTYWMMVFERNAEHPLIWPLARHLPLRGGRRQLVRNPKDFYRETLDRMTPEMSYAIVVYVWALASLHALSHCDLVLDMNQLHHRPYALDRSTAIQAGCQLEVSFDEARPIDAGADNIGDRRNLERAVLALLPKDTFGDFIEPRAAAPRLAELGKSKADLLASLI
jgi:hypothetical protein